MPEFSIITISYNVEDEIEGTIKSVLAQTCTDYEYIIIDGASSDRTVEICRSYEAAFKEKGISYKIVSEPDNGIYNAMNKGIDLVRGRWVQFLNAGDLLFDENVLDKIKAENISADVIYGDVIYSKDGEYRYRAGEPMDCFDTIKFKMPFCHQCSFTKRSILKEYRYNEIYKMCADHDLYLRLYRDKRDFFCVHIPISMFKMGGFSTESKNFKYLKEEILRISLDQGMIDEKEYEIRYKHDVEEAIAKRDSMRRRRAILKRFIEPLIPKSINQKRRKKKAQSLGWYDSIDTAIRSVHFD